MAARHTGASGRGAGFRNHRCAGKTGPPPAAPLPIPPPGGERGARVAGVFIGLDEGMVLGKEVGEDSAQLHMRQPDGEERGDAENNRRTKHAMLQGPHRQRVA